MSDRGHLLREIEALDEKIARRRRIADRMRAEIEERGRQLSAHTTTTERMQRLRDDLARELELVGE
jgi:hypothetical protein